MAHAIIFIGTLFISWYLTEALQYTEEVETAYGRIRGEEVNADGIEYKAFKGIPYAKPPIGELRFRAPVPPDRWTDVKDTVHYGHVCVVSDDGPGVDLGVSDVLLNFPNLLTSLTRSIRSSEDCLTLNVFTTQIRRRRLRPVLVYIYGGGFRGGDGTDSLFGPKYLVNENFVVVTFNYRLGSIGFLATKSSHATGNWGMKDQVAALQWVQENIAQFGGNPKRVTIYGESAGGVSVHLHLFSPLSRGLFHKMISSSGTSACDWAIVTDQERFSRNLANVTGASGADISNPADRVHFLRSVKAQTLVDKQEDVFDEPEDFLYDRPRYYAFAPVLEPAGTPGAFLTEDPKQLLAEGKFAQVPVMIGFNSLEGGALFFGESALSEEDLGKTNLNVCEYPGAELRAGITAEDACLKVSRQILDVYFGGRPTNSSVLQSVNFLGDIFIEYPVRQTEKWHARYATARSPAYFYYFDFDGKWNIMKKFTDIENLPGATHTDDLSYVFDEKVKRKPRLPPTSSEHITRERMISFITNFVKYGNPTPRLYTLIPVRWEPATRDTMNTLIIRDNLTMERDILEDRMNLWSSLYRKYANTPFHRL